MAISPPNNYSTKTNYIYIYYKHPGFPDFLDFVNTVGCITVVSTVMDSKKINKTDINFVKMLLIILSPSSQL